MHSDVLPNFGRHVERPDFVRHRRVLYNPAVHEYLVAEEHARVSITGQRSLSLDVRSFPNVPVVVINVYHLSTVEAFAADNVQRILPNDRTVAS